MPIQTVSQAFSNEGVGGFTFRNKFINGAMEIDQRNAGASVTPGTNSYTVDRWIVNNAASSKLTAQQSSTAPTGFTNSLLVTSTSAYTPSSVEPFYISQRVEGFNFADLAWGTANAKTVTLSFWVRSSLTGTFSGSFQNSLTDYSYPYTYTISSANTFEYKTVTISPPTAGTWVGGTNGVGVRLYFSMGAGSSYQGTAGSWSANDYRGATGETRIVETNGATFYITGVQLEVGSVATPFERRPYGMELQLCQRYFEQWDAGSAYCPIPTAHIISGPAWTFSAVPRVQKRTVPTVSLSNSSGSSMFSSYGTNASGAGFLWSGSLAVDTGSSGNIGIQIDSTLSGTGAGSPGSSVHNILRANQWIRFSAEL